MSRSHFSYNRKVEISRPFVMFTCASDTNTLFGHLNMNIFLIYWFLSGFCLFFNRLKVLGSSSVCRLPKPTYFSLSDVIIHICFEWFFKTVLFLPGPKSLMKDAAGYVKPYARSSLEEQASLIDQP